jgi:hypothetical protein
VRLELSTQTLTFLTGLLSAQLKKIRSRWRKRPAGRIAVIVPAALRHDQRLADLVGGNGLSRTTVDRWLKEMIDLLAARTPKLERVLAKIARVGGSVVLIDGSLIPTQHRTGHPMRRRWSAKHKRHGPLVIALTDVKGRLLWTSSARPARGSEITAAATTTWSADSARPASPRSPTSASSASTTWRRGDVATTAATRRSSPATRSPGARSSRPRRSRSTS